MQTGAPRRVLRDGLRVARGAGLAMGLWLAGAGTLWACDAPVTATAMPEGVGAPWVGDGDRLAWYDGPTRRYAHGVLGDAIEATELHYGRGGCRTHSVVLPGELVFEDTAPRLVDLDGDDSPEIVVVQSHQRLGAQLAIYAPDATSARLVQVAETPFIGSSNRWLAPIGAADLDGDGRIEIAYIDRPHLARTLRVWRFDAGDLTEIATAPGLTNHRIGDPTIPGGVRDCANGPELITADAAWSRVIATRLRPDVGLSHRDLGPWQPGALSAALAC